MAKRIFDFLSSVGMMLLGIIMLVGGSISVEKLNFQYPSFVLPSAKNKEKIIVNSNSNSQLPVSKPLIPLSKNKDVFPLELSAASVLVVDDKTDAILFSKNHEEVRPLASITKLMSVLVLSDLGLDWDASSTIQPQDISFDTQYVKKGEQFSIQDLWNASLIESSNTAIKALVREKSTSTEAFVFLMNEKAKKLHLTSLHFVEPTGLDSRNVGKVEDILRLLKIALLNKKIYSTLQMNEYYVQPFNNKKRLLSNTNWLLTRWIPHTFIDGNIVGKTGYIQDSGYNFVVRLEDNQGHAIRVGILGASSNESRFTEARDLGMWIFNEFIWPDQKEYHTLES